MSQGISINESALAESIRLDPVLVEVENARKRWKQKQLDKQADYDGRIAAGKAECRKLQSEIYAMQSRCRRLRFSVEQMKRARRHNFKMLKTIDRKETARLRFLRVRAVELAVAGARRKLAREMKVLTTL